MNARPKRSPSTRLCGYVAFLRGVSPMNAKMPALKQGFEAAGFTDVKTVLSSGNVVFNARLASDLAIAQKAEGAMTQQLGRSFSTIVRSQDALRELLDTDSWGPFRLAPEAKRVVSFFRKPPRAVPQHPIELDGARILALQEITTRTWGTVQKVANLPGEK